MSDQISVYGYGLLDEAWTFRMTGRFDDAKPLRIKPGYTIGDWRIVDAWFRNVPHWPGFDAHNCDLLIGPFTITQIALLRIDGTPIDVRDLDVPFEVPQGSQLDYGRIQISVSEERVRNVAGRS